MVPNRDNPPDNPRSFSPDIQAALEAAMRESWAGEEPPEALRAAVKAAARDARDRMLRAEEMLVAFKALEQRVYDQHRKPVSSADRARVIRALIDAYYLD